MNNFAYADDFALVCPSAAALNDLLRVCEAFAVEHYVTFSTSKSVCMLAKPNNCHIASPPSIYLSGQALEYVSNFTYLGHIITSDFYDDEDIKKETRRLCARGNAISRQFKHCTMDVKRTLFMTYCYSLYCSSLWTNFRMAPLNRLRVNYNNIMRRLAGVPTWHSARTMFVNLRVDSFPERLRWLCHGTRERIEACENAMVTALRESDARVWSPLWQRWTDLLHRPPAA